MRATISYTKVNYHFNRQIMLYIYTNSKIYVCVHKPKNIHIKWNSNDSQCSKHKKHTILMITYIFALFCLFFFSFFNVTLHDLGFKFKVYWLLFAFYLSSHQIKFWECSRFLLVSFDSAIVTDAIAEYM